jgi:hypothetical protein
MVDHGSSARQWRSSSTSSSSRSHQSRDEQNDEWLQCHEELMQNLMQAAYRSRLLASSPTAISRSAFRYSSPIDGSGYWLSPTPWESPPGGQVPSPFGSSPLRTPPLRPMTSMPPTVRQDFVKIGFICLLDYFTFLTHSFTCLSGWLRITTQQEDPASMA